MCINEYVCTSGLFFNIVPQLYNRLDPLLHELLYTFRENFIGGAANHICISPFQLIVVGKGQPLRVLLRGPKNYNLIGQDLGCMVGLSRAIGVFKQCRQHYVFIVYQFEFIIQHLTVICTGYRHNTFCNVQEWEFENPRTM
jgi:hypothetical protein